MGSSYDLVGEASSYLRSGLSALPMFLPRVGSGIRDFADCGPGRRRALITSRHSDNGTVDLTRCDMFAGSICQGVITGNGGDDVIHGGAGNDGADTTHTATRRLTSDT